MMLDDLPMVGFAGAVLMLILLGFVKISIGRPERRCIDCRHYRTRDGMCLNAGPLQRNPVTGTTFQRLISARDARMSINTPEECGHGAHRFEAKPKTFDA